MWVRWVEAIDWGRQRDVLCLFLITATASCPFLLIVLENLLSSPSERISEAFGIALSIFDDRVYEALRIYYCSSLAGLAGPAGPGVFASNFFLATFGIFINIHEVLSRLCLGFSVRDLPPFWMTSQTVATRAGCINGARRSKRTQQKVQQIADTPVQTSMGFLACLHSASPRLASYMHDAIQKAFGIGKCLRTIPLECQGLERFC